MSSRECVAITFGRRGRYDYISGCDEWSWHEREITTIILHGIGSNLQLGLTKDSKWRNDITGVGSEEERRYGRCSFIFFDHF